jgi:hypothetical protein
MSFDHARMINLSIAILRLFYRMATTWGSDCRAKTGVSVHSGERSRPGEPGDAEIISGFGPIADVDGPVIRRRLRAFIPVVPARFGCS